MVRFANWFNLKYTTSISRNALHRDVSPPVWCNPSANIAGSKGGAVGGVGGVNTYQAQQYLGYSAPVGDAHYSLTGLMPRPAPPANSYYSPYQQAAPAPTYPMQFSQPPQSGAFGSQFISSQLQAAAVQQMQVSVGAQYREIRRKLEIRITKKTMYTRQADRS